MGSKTLAVTVKQNLLGDALSFSAQNKDLAAMKFVLEQGWDSKKRVGACHEFEWMTWFTDGFGGIEGFKKVCV